MPWWARQEFFPTFRWSYWRLQNFGRGSDFSMNFSIGIFIGIFYFIRYVSGKVWLNTWDKLYANIILLDKAVCVSFLGIFYFIRYVSGKFWLNTWDKLYANIILLDRAVRLRYAISPSLVVTIPCILKNRSGNAALISSDHYNHTHW